MEWSLSKTIRIESGVQRLAVSGLMTSRRCFSSTGFKDPEKVDSLLALARVARERSWWSAYRDIAPHRSSS